MSIIVYLNKSIVQDIMKTQIRLMDLKREVETQQIRREKRKKKLEQKRYMNIDIKEIHIDISNKFDLLINKQQINDLEQYQQVLRQTQQILNNQDIQQYSQIYQNLELIKQYGINNEQFYDVVVEDLVKDEFSLLRKLCGLLMYPNEKDYLIIYLCSLVLYVGQKIENFVVQYQDEFEELVLNIIDIFLEEEEKEKKLNRYHAQLFVVQCFQLNIDIKKMIQEKKVQFILQKITEYLMKVDHCQDAMQLLVLFSYIMKLETDNKQYSNGVSNFLKYYLFNIIKHYGEFQIELLQKTVGCLANIIDIPNSFSGKQKLELAELINNDLEYQDNLGIMKHIFNGLKQKPRSMEYDDLVDHMSYMVEKVFDLKRILKFQDEDIKFMKLMQDVVLGLVGQSRKHVYERGLRIMLKYIQVRRNSEIRIQIVSQQVLVEILEIDDWDLLEIGLQIVIECIDLCDGLQVEQLINKEVFLMILSKVGLEQNKEVISKVIIIIQSLLIDDEQHQTISYRHLLFKEKTLDLLQEHKDQDIYESALYIIKEFYDFEEQQY